jgi:hypothetical protein
MVDSADGSIHHRRVRPMLVAVPDRHEVSLSGLAAIGIVLTFIFVGWN